MNLNLVILATLIVRSHQYGEYGKRYNVEEAFIDNSISPDVTLIPPKRYLIAEFPLKTEYFDITIGKTVIGVITRPVLFGNRIGPKQVTEIPEVYYEADMSQYYALTFTDPDYPSTDFPYRREWRYWVSFYKTRICDDIISYPPSKKLYVKYSSGREVNLGNRLYSYQILEPPEVSYDAVPVIYYALSFTDLDNPSYDVHLRREFRHWLVVNIPGNKTSEGEVLSEYQAPQPLRNSGPHRCTFLLYRQRGYTKFGEPRIKADDTNRGMFNSERFMKTYDLFGPVAGNFFFCQYPEFNE